MFFKQMNLINRLDKLAGKGANILRKYSGINRRAEAMLPGTAVWNGSEKQISQASKLRQLLLKIEANQLSYCIKISSPKRKSRAAAVIFRGRVVGCIYGQKRMEKQAFGKQAYQLMLSDVCCPTIIIKTDELKEDFALAAASLFSGDIFQAEADTNPQDSFQSAYMKLEQSLLPGTIVVTSGEDMFAAIIYVFNGKIIGIFSYKEGDGWVSNTYEKAVQLISRIPQAKISSSVLTAKNVDEVFSLSFAMSHLSEVKESEFEPYSQFELAYALVTNYDHEKLRRATASIFCNPFIPNTVHSDVHTGRTVLDQ